MTYPVTNEKEREITLTWIDNFEESVRAVEDDITFLVDEGERAFANLMVLSYRAQIKELQEAVWEYDKRHAYGQRNRTTNTE